MIDLHQLSSVPSSSSTRSEMDKTKLENDKRADPKKSAVRLDRYRIPLQMPVTAVSAHPTQHIVVCGGANMHISVVSSVGEVLYGSES